MIDRGDVTCVARVPNCLDLTTHLTSSYTYLFSKWIAEP